DPRLAVASGMGRIGLAQHDEQLAAGVHRSRRPPLAAVDHVAIALALDAALDVGRVRGGYGRLGHREAGANVALQQRLEPLPLLGVRAIVLENLDVARIGPRAVENL